MMKYKALKDIATITMGQSPDSSSYNEQKNGIPFYQGNADFGELYPTARVWCSKPKKIAKENDILISVRAPIGALNYATEECCIGRGLAAITIENDSERNYVFHLLKAKNKELNSKGTGSTFKAISKSVLEETQVPVISKEQQEISMKLIDVIEQIIRQRKQALQRLDELIKARFVEMFGDPFLNPMGWKKEKAEKHIDLLSGYPFQSEQYVDDGVNICGGLIIMPQRIQWEECKQWPSIEGFEKYILRKGDIVMALDRPWISEGFKIARVDGDHLPALLIQRTVRIRGIDINQEYLYYCFLNCGFDKHSNVTGSLVPHISAKDICSFEIMLPPKELQNCFAALVKQVDKSKVVIQKALDETQKLFDSLMQKYFK